MIHLLSPQLLRRHIARRPHHDAGGGKGRRDGGTEGRRDWVSLYLSIPLSLRLSVPPSFSLSVYPELRQSEVKHLHQPVFAGHNVLWFDVAMSDSGVVRRLQRGGYLRGDFQRLAQPDAQLRRFHYPLAQCFSLDVLGHDEAPVINLS